MTILGLSDFLKKELREITGEMRTDRNYKFPFGLTKAFTDVGFNEGLVVGDNAWRERIKKEIEHAQKMIDELHTIKEPWTLNDYERHGKWCGVLEALRGLLGK